MIHWLVAYQTKNIPLKVVVYKDWTENEWKSSQGTDLWKTFRKPGEQLLKMTLNKKKHVKKLGVAQDFCTVSFKTRLYKLWNCTYKTTSYLCCAKTWNSLLKSSFMGFQQVVLFWNLKNVNSALCCCLYCLRFISNLSQHVFQYGHVCWKRCCFPLVYSAFSLGVFVQLIMSSFLLYTPHVLQL